MDESARKLHGDWMVADQLAREAEKLLAHDWEGYFAGLNDVPDRTVVEIAMDMRERATEKHQLLVGYVNATRK